MASRERPLSPHLQVYKWQVQMVSSILHRATGVVLAVAVLGLVWALAALAAGPESWARFTACLGSPLGWLVVAGTLWSLSYHLINGIRHLLQDAGMGFSIPEFVRNSWISIIGSVVLTVVLLAIIVSRAGGAA